MPGKRETRIPSTIQKSDRHAQAIWKKAHDSAIKTYGEGGAAHRVAYAALKHEYEKKGDRWVAKGWKGPSDPQAAQGYRNKPKPTAGGKVARTEKEAVEKRKQARREYAENRRKRMASHRHTKAERPRTTKAGKPARRARARSATRRKAK